MSMEFPGKNTCERVAISYSRDLPGILHLLLWQVDSLTLNHLGSLTHTHANIQIRSDGTRIGELQLTFPFRKGRMRDP